MRCRIEPAEKSFGGCICSTATTRALLGIAIDAIFVRGVLIALLPAMKATLRPSGSTMPAPAAMVPVQRDQQKASSAWWIEPAGELVRTMRQLSPSLSRPASMVARSA